MKPTALLLLGFGLCAASGFSQTESEIRDRIVGTWKLVSAIDIMKDGSTRPYRSSGAQAYDVKTKVERVLGRIE
jgi:hypothetical protein